MSETLKAEDFGLGLDVPVTAPVFVESRVSIRRSDRVDKLIPALIAAQLEYDVVAKDAENEFFSKGLRKSKYATLDSAVTATRPHLNKHGLTIIQHLTSSNKDKELTVTTCLYHISEQFFESELTLPSAQGLKFDPQTLASASTYGRRVTWLAISGAAPGDDDDANKASGNEGSREAAQAVAKEKIAALRESGQPLSGNSSAALQAQNPDDKPALTYTWNDANQTAKIDGPDILLKLHKPYLKQFWSASARALVVNAEQLENLKYELEQRKVPFYQNPNVRQ